MSYMNIFRELIKKPHLMSSLDTLPTPDKDDSGSLIYEVINARSIVRDAHLLPIFGTESPPEQCTR